MTSNDDTRELGELAQGRLAPAARQALAQRALRDPALAARLKLALRLADASAELARDWVALAQRPAVQSAGAQWWRPLAGVAASLAILAAVLALPRAPQGGATSPLVAELGARPDRIGQMSFEVGSEMFGGSFEGERPEMFGGSFEASD